jgi:hypothetical protein
VHISYIAKNWDKVVHTEELDWAHKLSFGKLPTVQDQIVARRECILVNGITIDSSYCHNESALLVFSMNLDVNTLMIRSHKLLKLRVVLSYVNFGCCLTS